MTPQEFEEMQKYAAFGRSLIELAKDCGIIPKRNKTRVVVREKVKVVVRRRRRTQEQIQADAAQAQLVRDNAITQ